MSHELRTPLVAILGYAELIRSSAPGTEERQRADVVYKNGSHLLSLLNEILDLSKIEADKMTVEPGEVSLRELFSDVDRLFHLRADEKGIGLTVRSEGPIPVVVRTDGTRLRQILLNLAANAIKFTPRGKVEIAARYEPGVGRLVVDVVDTGIGLTDEQRARIFAPFVQADATTARRFGGTGLGLHLSRQLARLLGGDIAVVSRPGEGSRFTVSIDAPALGDERFVVAPAAVERPLEAQTRPVLAGMRVLLAEDNLDNQRLLAFQLEGAGARVDCAADGQRVLDLVEDRGRTGAGYDVILMDVQMPGLDGLEATRLLRQRGYAGAIVALTAHALAEEKERTLAAGCDECLTKPITREALVRAVETRRLPVASDIETLDDSGQASFEEIRAGFLRGLDASVRSLRDAAAREDFAEVERVAHKLRGAGGSFGFPEITRAGAELEAAACSRAHLGPGIELLERACDEASRAIAAKA
jgi:CheY-like chemotaxis protein